MDFLKNITFNIALGVLGAIFFFLGLSGGFSVSSYSFTIQDTLSRVISSIFGATLIGVAIYIEITTRPAGEKVSTKKAVPYQAGQTPKPIESHPIQDIPDRPSYLDSMIEYTENANESIFLSVHTLNPSKSDEKVKILQNKLEKAKATGKDVRILAPGGFERVEATYELAMLRRIPIRILTFLEDEDFRFTIVDNDLTIISIKSKDSNNAISVGAVIRSERLNRLLKSYFNDLWRRPDTIDYDSYLLDMINKLIDPMQPLSVQTIAQRLRIPASEVERIQQRPQTHNNQKASRVIFLLGRPGSGKTSTANLIVEQLQKVGLSKSQIGIHNDYDILWSLFQNDRQQQDFEPGPTGGFRVKNFKVLDECLCILSTEGLRDLEDKPLVILEFSRNNYLSAFNNIDAKLRELGIMVYLYAPVSTCLARNKTRGNPNDHANRGVVPPDILQTYYREDDADLFREKFPNSLVWIDNSQNDISLFKDEINRRIVSRLGF